MMNTYKDYLSDNFLQKIEDITHNMGMDSSVILKKTGKLFIFINSKKYFCKCIHESELNTPVENYSFNYFIVLLSYESEHAEFINNNYRLIGFFNMSLQETKVVKFNHIQLNSFQISSDFGYGIYDQCIIRHFDIHIMDNPYKKYLDTTLKPVIRSLQSVLPDNFHFEDIDIQKEDFPLSIFESRVGSSFTLPDKFQDFLLFLKELDENVGDQLFTYSGSSKFNPE